MDYMMALFKNMCLYLGYQPPETAQLDTEGMRNSTRSHRLLLWFRDEHNLPPLEHSELLIRKVDGGVIMDFVDAHDIVELPRAAAGHADDTKARFRVCRPRFNRMQKKQYGLKLTAPTLVPAGSILPEAKNKYLGTHCWSIPYDGSLV